MTLFFNIRYNLPPGMTIASVAFVFVSGLVSFIKAIKAIGKRHTTPKMANIPAEVVKNSPMPVMAGAMKYGM